MIYVLDTHALIWHLTASPRLSAKAARAMQDPSAEFVISAMALVEIQYLSARNRVQVSLGNVLEFISNSDQCSIRVVDADVARHLPAGLNIHDGVICATTMLLAEQSGDEVALLTSDKQIIQSGLVATLW